MHTAAQLVNLSDKNLYHGSRSETSFGEFETDGGAFFTTDRDYAESFRRVAEDMGNSPIPVICVRVRVERPRIYDGEDPEQFQEFTDLRRTAEEVHAAGYDAEVLLFADGHFDVAVYSAEQIDIIEVA